jgi:hypothetical protein
LAWAPTVAQAQPPILSGFEAQLTVSGLRPELGDRVFSGHGTMSGMMNGAGSGQDMSFAARGSDLGFAHPWLPTVHFELSGYFLRHLGIGVRFGYGWGGHADQPAGRSSLADQVDTGSLGLTQIGGVLRGVLPITSWASLRVSTFLGYRSYGVSITAFDKVPCGRGGTCYPSASSEQFSFETRLEGAVAFGARSPVSLVAFVGAELSPPLAFTAGAGLALGRHDFPDSWSRRRAPIATTPPPPPPPLEAATPDGLAPGAEEPPPDPPPPPEVSEPPAPPPPPPPVLPPVLPPPPVFGQPDPPATPPAPAPATKYPPLRSR